MKVDQVRDSVDCRVDKVRYFVKIVDVVRVDQVRCSPGCNIGAIFDSSLSLITPVLASLHWLPVRACISFKVCLVVCRLVHDQSHEYVKGFINDHEPTGQLRSAQNGTLVKLGQFSMVTVFFCCSSRYGMFCQTMFVLSQRLKTHLLDNILCDNIFYL